MSEPSNTVPVSELPLTAGTAANDDLPASAPLPATEPSDAEPKEAGSLPAASLEITVAPAPLCKATHIVEAGDTLYMIAQEYDVPVALLMESNRVANPYNLKIGQRICIPCEAKLPDETPSPQYPGCTENIKVETEPADPPAAPPAKPAPPERPFPMHHGAPCPHEPAIVCADTHIVKAGDTLYQIAKTHGVALDALMHANPGLNPYELRIGTQLCIPPGK